MASKILALAAIIAAIARASPVHNQADVTDNLGLMQMIMGAKADKLDVTQETPAWDVNPFDYRRSNASNTTTPTPTAATTPTPTAAATQIAQRVSFTGVTAAQYTGATKLAFEQGYGAFLGTYNTTTKVWVTGASVTSAVATRRAINVDFTATVPATHASAAQTSANNLATGGSYLTALTNHITSAATANGHTSMPSITTTGAQSPTVTTVGSSPTPTPTAATTSGADQTSILGASAIFAIAIALKL